MEFYDEEYEKAYKPDHKYEYVDERASVLVDFALVVLAIAIIMELFKSFW